MIRPRRKVKDSRKNFALHALALFISTVQKLRRGDEDKVQYRTKIKTHTALFLSFSLSLCLALVCLCPSPSQGESSFFGYHVLGDSRAYAWIGLHLFFYEQK
ncbi:MAG: hypothetical protein BYD32DRAFT_230847 [Podila humilis]|nr:MAG: hypothetical protein BYD32DRAFT_230847 [Podila humilis]